MGHVNLLPFARRHEPSLTAKDLEAVDAEIKAQHMTPCTVLMFSFDEKCQGQSTELALERTFEGLEVIRPILQMHKALELESMLHIFEDASDALIAVMEVRNALAELNATKDDCDKIAVSGFGIHSGSLLRVPSTDLHWGDPVNTASKLGQDVAKNGAVLISRAVFDAVNAPGSPFQQQALTSHFEEVKITISKVEMDCYVVTTEKETWDTVSNQFWSGMTGRGCFGELCCFVGRKDGQAVNQNP